LSKREEIDRYRKLSGLFLFPFLAVLFLGFVVIYKETVISNGQIITGNNPNLPWKKIKQCRFIPEYRRYMKKAVISLAQKNITLNLHHELIKRLPEYTEIVILLPEQNQDIIRRELKRRIYNKEIQFVTFNTVPQENAQFFVLFPEKDKLVQFNTNDILPCQQGSLWAQDFFEVGQLPDGDMVLLASTIHKYYYSVGGESNFNVNRDNLYLNHLASTGMDVLNLPLVFMGGNILIDEVGGQRIVFCGGDVFRATRTAWRAVMGAELSHAEFIKMIRNIFHTDEIVLAGEENAQPTQMYHLDQAMILLPNKVAGITNIIEDESIKISGQKEVAEAQRFLETLRGKLKKRGYKLLDIDISIDNLLHCQHYVNAVPYIDTPTNQKVLLMPVFTSARKDIDKKITIKNSRTFESQGYKVVHVPTCADKIRGGIHCLINVIK